MQTHPFHEGFLFVCFFGGCCLFVAVVFLSTYYTLEDDCGIATDPDGGEANIEV